MKKVCEESRGYEESPQRKLGTGMNACKKVWTKYAWYLEVNKGTLNSSSDQLSVVSLFYSFILGV